MEINKKSLCKYCGEKTRYSSGGYLCEKCNELKKIVGSEKCTIIPYYLRTQSLDLFILYKQIPNKVFVKIRNNMLKMAKKTIIDNDIIKKVWIK